MPAKTQAQGQHIDYYSLPVSADPKTSLFYSSRARILASITQSLANVDIYSAAATMSAEEYLSFKACINEVLTAAFQIIDNIEELEQSY